MAYNKFIESRIFGKQVNALLSDDEFELFQGVLFSPVIQQTGGLRKVRWTGGPREKAEAAACE